jgi:hypothetical protein
MPAEIEAPTEHLHETLHEKAEGHHEGGPPWVSQVALSAAVLAVVAAVAALYAGHYANEAMLEQMQATDLWAQYQAKGIKASLVESRVDILKAVSKDVKEEDAKNVERYRDEQKEIKEKADEKEKESKVHMEQHSALAKSVTTFQVAIALSAISVLTKKKTVWFLSLVGGTVGIVLAALAMVH